MVDESKTPDLRLLDELLRDSPDIVPLKIAAYSETTSPDEIATYVAAAQFLAFWLEKQNGAAGNDTEALFEQFKNNVCAIMARGAIRT